VITWFQALAFFKFDLYRYTTETAAEAAADATAKATKQIHAAVGLCTLESS
jgi:hypothetical protein